MSRFPHHVPPRRLLAAAGLLVVVIVVAVAVNDPFVGRAASNGGVVDNAAPTSLATVQRTSVAEQTQVSGTLGYAGSWTIAAPTGTAQAALQQAEQQAASAAAALTTARAGVAADEQTLAQAAALLRAAQLKESADCAGTNAAAAVSGGSGSSPGTSTDPSGGSNGSPCANSMQAVTADQTAVSASQQKAQTDRAQLASARATLTSARQALGAEQAYATPYGSSPSYTMLPTPGRVVRRGQPLYAIDGHPALLLYGGTPAWRAFAPGMSAGRDVAELNANLSALGYGDVTGDAFTSATEQAVRALQRARALTPSGTLALGEVVFEPEAVRVTTVTPAVGEAVQPGAVLTVSSTRHDVSIQLDASQQSEVKAGDRVTVTLPDNSNTPGVVSAVGKVATTPSSDQNGGGGSSDSGNGSSTPTIEVDVRLLRAAAAGTLDQAPVNVSITTASVNNVLAVPVNALVALAGGGYAVEVVEAGGTHQLVGVTPGLFDDAQGFVQVSGSGLDAGRRVVVPAS